MTASDHWYRDMRADSDLTDRLRADIVGLHVTTYGADDYDPAFISTVAWGLTTPEGLGGDPTGLGVYPPDGHGFPEVL